MPTSAMCFCCTCRAGRSQPVHAALQHVSSMAGLAHLEGQLCCCSTSTTLSCSNSSSRCPQAAGAAASAQPHAAHSADKAAWYADSKNWDCRHKQRQLCSRGKKLAAPPRAAACGYVRHNCTVYVCFAMQIKGGLCQQLCSWTPEQWVYSAAAHVAGRDGAQNGGCSSTARAV
jgi:hypothetical protein